MSIDDCARSAGGVAGTEADAVDGVVPRWVIRPESVEAVQDAVRALGNAAGTLVASGLGAHLGIGAPPETLDVLLRLDRMNRITDHAAADMTVTVEAGCSLAALDEELASTGQWLPIDPPGFAQTTVGGLIAANLSGPLRTSQGSARDLLIGCSVVGADGALVRGGGRVVKNVAGYDLPKLHIGALGTLAVIVEATFKLRPRPEREAMLVLHAQSADARAAQQIADAALTLREALDPLWLEIVGPGLAGVAAPSIRADAWSLAVGLGGLAVEIEDGAARVREIAAQLSLTERSYEEPTAREEAEARAADHARAARRRLADLALARAAGVETRPSERRDVAAVLRAATLPTDVGALLARAIAAAAEVGVPIACTAQPGTGIVRFAVAPGDASRAATADTVRGLVSRLRPALEAERGALVIERALPEVKRLLVREPGVWGHPGEGLTLMHRIKHTFDPERRLAPGRLVEL